MEATGYSKPMRAITRYKALVQLQHETDAGKTSELLDEELFLEIAAILFNSKENKQLYQWRISKAEAVEVENRVAAELVTTYKWIKLRQKNLIVQTLNALL